MQILTFKNDHRIDLDECANIWWNIEDVYGFTSQFVHLLPLPTFVRWYFGHVDLDWILQLNQNVEISKVKHLLLLTYQQMMEQNCVAETLYMNQLQPVGQFMKMNGLINMQILPFKNDCRFALDLKCQYLVQN